MAGGRDIDRVARQCRAAQVGKMASILVKVVMDMWLHSDPRETLVLTLPMLTAALRQPERTYRTRVFDLLYTLSLHAQMIEPVPVSDQGATGGSGGGGSGSLSHASPMGAHLERLQPEITRDVAGGHGPGEVRGHGTSS